MTTITPSTIGAAPDDAKYIVQTASSGLSAEQALGSLATGLLKNTTTTGVLSIAGASDLPDHASRHENGGADEVALDASQITSGTMATARLGSGTASSSTYLRGDQTWGAVSGSVDGSGSNGHVAFWTDSDTLSGESNLFWDASNNRLGIGDSTPSYPLDVAGDIRCTSEILTGSGVRWDFGAVSTGVILQTSHLALVQIDGTYYYMMLWNGGS